MSMPLILTASAAIEQAARVELGIVHAYDGSPDVIGWWPCSLRYPRTGDLEYSKGLGGKSIHHWVVEVHFERSRGGGLARCEALARETVERFRDVYARNLSLNGTCDVSGFDKPSWEYGRLIWADEETFGVRFYLWAKEMLDGVTVEL